MSVVRLKKNSMKNDAASSRIVSELNSLVKLAVHWDQSPGNWHSIRSNHIGTSPRGWKIRRCQKDVIISIMCDVPLRKRIII